MDKMERLRHLLEGETSTETQLFFEGDQIARLEAKKEELLTRLGFILYSNEETEKTEDIRNELQLIEKRIAEHKKMRQSLDDSMNRGEKEK